MSNDGRFYLITPQLSEAAAFIPRLSAALEGGNAACVLAQLAPLDDAAAKKLVKALADNVQARDVALIIGDNDRLALRAGADGVHISGDAEAVAAALGRLKPDRIVGVGGLRTRDDAMGLGEAGVDYVMFGEPKADGFVPPAEQTLERVEWWAQIFNLPCVGYAATLADVGPLAKAGADFIALGSCLWDDPRGVAVAMQEAASQAANYPLPVA